MEFQGRIKKVLPLRSGTSQRTGNNWKCLPFVFEFFENETDRWPDSVVLETFDEKVIANLQEGMEVRCGFGHRTKEYDGKTFNEIRLYKIESVKSSEKPAQQPQPQPASEQPVAQHQQQQAQEQPDDLPF
jgi:hypothetical protein